MNKFYTQLLGIIALLATATPARPQNSVMQVHSNGGVAYEILTAKVDSVTFRASLADTSWKLVGFVEAKTNVLTKPEPREWVHSYTLIFYANGKLEGGTHDRNIYGEYTVDYNTSTIKLTVITSRAGGQDIGYSYLGSLYNVDSFSIVNGYLRLYYDDGENYLLFKSW